MSKRSRRYSEAAAQIGQSAYAPQEAVELIRKLKSAKFDETVELHLHTSADPQQQGQQLRETASLPAGTGKPITVMVFTGAEHLAAAKEAGADYVSDEATLAKIEGGWTAFNTSIASQDMMPKIAKLGRILGRKGLMPSTRSGTVVKPDEIPSAIAAAKLGKVEVRIDKGGSIHVPIGVISFESPQIMSNLMSVYETVRTARPQAIKGQFITSATLTSTMGPAVKIDLEQLAATEPSG